MNKSIYVLIALFVSILSFTSCEETEAPDPYANWASKNQAFLDSLAKEVVPGTDSTKLFKLYPLFTTTKYSIYARKLVEVKEGRTPIYTSWVKMYYRGKQVDGYVFDQNFLGENPENTDPPSLFAVSPLYNPETQKTGGVIDGWQEVLQRMKVGERWIVYIPYQLAYGVSGYNTIRGYSTLIFDMTLLDTYLTYPYGWDE